MHVIEKHYRKNYKRLVTMAKSRVGMNDAEDVVQDTYLSAWSYYNPDKVTDLNKWIGQIFKHSTYKVAQDQRNRGVLHIPLEDIEEPAVETDHSKTEVANFIEMYGGDDQFILTLVLIHEHPIVDIAERFNVHRLRVYRIVASFIDKIKEKRDKRVSV